MSPRLLYLVTYPGWMSMHDVHEWHRATLRYRGSRTFL